MTKVRARKVRKTMRGIIRPRKGFIVKVQVSLFSSAGTPMVLAYDNDRKYIAEVKATPEIVEAVGPLQKAYFNACVHRGEIVLLNKVRSQNW